MVIPIYTGLRSIQILHQDISPRLTRTSSVRFKRSRFLSVRPEGAVVAAAELLLSAPE